MHSVEVVKEPPSPAEARWRAAWTASKCHIEAWESTVLEDDRNVLSRFVSFLLAKSINVVQ
jgi:hypothetical protein